ncbi:unnamed protein product [Orchesella dallaii]|uniref:SCP domain-containing protein n=1 Tax=Orchesella dallaii TaxID=48710 RepID=A0ABP1PI40_9HEXA
MARLALAAFCIVALAATSSAMTFTEYGIGMACTAYNSACWYENLKQFPNTNAKGFMKCTNSCNFQKEQALKQSGEDRQKMSFTQGVTQYGMKDLPSEFASNCNSHLKSGSATTSDDESDVLNDQHQEYPFRAFAYCIMKTVRSKYGDIAIEAVRNEKTHSLKHWKQTLLDRDNEFRALHGSPPFKRVTDLDNAAQKWADKNAAECNMYHSKNDDAGRQWRGKGTGESISSGGGSDEKENAAYLASNGWYEEYALYPFPGGIKDANDPRFQHVGHFTQTVWKGTEYVGYGYAYNPKCSPYTHYIAARYSPAGNMAGGFQENVVPRQ